LLVTSRETRRWVVPRGNPIPKLTPADSAAQEAFEEAGIRGAVSASPLGSYRYDKRRKNGAVVATEVRLFAMAVAEELDSWPEAGQRQRRWFARDEAAEAVDEPDLKDLLRGLDGSALLSVDASARRALDHEG
jgi:8-oxo-dGTP pyrophosphatase MutT (NUDIX family)